MRKLKTLSTLLLTLILTFAMSITTFAYNYKDYETYPNSDWDSVIIKSNNSKAVNNVVVYILANTSSDRTVANTNSHFEFFCRGGEAAEGRNFISLVYQFNPANREIVDTLNDNEIWVWSFKIENGDYEFACDSSQASGRNNLPDMYALQTDYTFNNTRFDDNGELIDDREIITMNDGDSIRVYAMYGVTSWREANYEAFKEWAINTESELKERDAELEKLEQEKAALEESIEVEEPTLESTTTPSVEPASTPENNAVKSEERKDDNEEQLKDKDNDNGGLVGIIIGGIVGVGVLGGVGITLAKKRKK